MCYCIGYMLNIVPLLKEEFALMIQHYSISVNYILQLLQQYILFNLSAQKQNGLQVVLLYGVLSFLAQTLHTPDEASEDNWAHPRNSPSTWPPWYRNHFPCFFPFFPHLSLFLTFSISWFEHRPWKRWTTCCYFLLLYKWSQNIWVEGAAMRQHSGAIVSSSYPKEAVLSCQSWHLISFSLIFQ